MPRRAVASATPNRASSNVSFRDTSILPIPDATYQDNIAQLRQNWKWAAFSQFFYTFAQLLQMPDVTLTDVEDDLARGTALYLPRIMQRLLYTLTQDRKVTMDTWQSALRKQYLRRDPDLNPLGIEPPALSRKQSREPTVFSEAPFDHEHIAQGTESTSHTPLPNHTENDAGNAEASSPAAQDTATPQKEEDAGMEERATSPQDDEIKTEEDIGGPALPPQDEPKDWFDLPLLTRLDSLHLLIEWQFQNPHRLRTFMRDDGDAAQWRHEPIGYDAKTNAYWLIGPDRLWIQRVPPKPPRQSRKRKAPAKKAPAKASTSKAAAAAPDSLSESENEPTPSKRRRTTERTSSGRPTRSKATENAPATSGRGTRAAKLQADKKLAAQAKELAEYQRQAALLESPSRSSGRATRQTRNSESTQDTPRRTLGTRSSARLRGSTHEDDDEWQQIPEEWLKENADDDSEVGSNRAARGRARGRGRDTSAVKGKAKAKARTRARARARIPVDEDEDEGEDEDEELKHLAEQAGLESDGESSALTELSDEQQEDAAEKAKHSTENVNPAKSKSPSKEKDLKEAKRSEGPEPDQKPSEDAQDHIPPGFVEWETICVTLNEWEHITERFEKATHYLEKALYKVLSQNIVPIVTEELRVVERKRKMDEALVHRKRSSRIAMKEIEKEEARLAAKKKAEEEEKLARVRRAEVRAKKEEAEREKREQAREQRRLEREERERLKQEQQEREVAEVDVVSSEPVKTPSVNGAGTSRHTSRVATPSGVRSPDWVLDCEICHKSGVNLDDGQAMVCCNSCQRWQHIGCHDIADRNAGRPPRDWMRQQFHCQRCRPTHSRVLNGSTHPQRPVDQYAWSQSQSQKTIPPPPQPPYPTPASDARYSQYPNYENGAPYQQQYVHNAALPQTSYPRLQRPQGNITFSHYQPEQGGFSRSAQQPMMAASPPWPGGYPPSNGMSSRSQQPMQLPQYSQNGMYSGGRVAPSYQYQTTPQQPFNNGIQDPVTPNTNGNWANTPNDYYSAANASQISASQMTAAESLAYMQRSGRHGWSNGSVQPPQNNNYPASVHLPPMAPPHHYPPS